MVSKHREAVPRQAWILFLYIYAVVVRADSPDCPSVGEDASIDSIPWQLLEAFKTTILTNTLSIKPNNMVTTVRTAHTRQFFGMAHSLRVNQKRSLHSLCRTVSTHSNFGVSQKHGLKYVCLEVAAE